MAPELSHLRHKFSFLTIVNFSNICRIFLKCTNYVDNILIIFVIYRRNIGTRGLTVSAKRNKFVELAVKRVTRAIKDMRLVGNLSNRSAYEYSEDDVKKIVRALQKEVDTVKARFSENGSGSDADFSL